MVSISRCVPGSPLSGTSQGDALLVVLSQRTDPQQKAGVGWHFLLLCFLPCCPLFLKKRTAGGEGEKGRCSAQNVPVERTQGAQDSWQLVPQEVSPCCPA